MNLIDVKDYPKETYDAFWEIVINSDTLEWEVRIMNRGPDTKVIASKKGKAKDMEVARLESQTWVKAQMENYKK
jgi:hypothetical protein